MHRLALRAGRKVRAMPAGAPRTRALDALWAGEANCPYWHGVFGGVYLPHIRGAAFSNLIAAESMADAAQHAGPYALGETGDLDGDGAQEVRLATDTLVLTVDPAHGGRVVEWGDRPGSRHIGNVLTRRPEAYHAELRRPPAAAHHDGVESIHTTAVRVKEPGLDRYLIYDRERRVSQRFHLLADGTTLERVWRDEQEELGGFATGPYQWALSEDPRAVSLRLNRESPLGRGHAAVERHLELGAGRRGLHHRLRVRWQGDEPLRALAALEWGLGVFGGPDDLWVEAAGRRLSLHELGELPAADHVTVTEAHSGLTLAFTLSRAAESWSFPLITVSNSEGGYERTDQGAVLIFRWPIALEPGQAWEETTWSEIAGSRVKSQ
jgi:alpha-amylase